jgi:hypothetical protein
MLKGFKVMNGSLRAAPKFNDLRLKRYSLIHEIETNYDLPQHFFPISLQTLVKVQQQRCTCQRPMATLPEDLSIESKCRSKPEEHN